MNSALYQGWVSHRRHLPRGHAFRYRIGLLYRITRVLAANGIALELAKISTMGERVEDTFLIHAPELSSTRFQTELEHQLLEALDTN